MTVAQTKPRRTSREERLKLKAVQVLTAMQRGECLLLELRWFGRCWSLSGGRSVDDEVAKIVVKHSRVVGVGDALFRNTPSQTWRWAGE
jgi:hypothetical protein